MEPENSSFELAMLIHVCLQPKEIVSCCYKIQPWENIKSHKVISSYGLKTSTSDEIRQECLHFFTISQSLGLSPKSAKCVCSLFDRERSSSGARKCARSETDNFGVNFCHVLSRFYLWKRILTIQSVLREFLLTVNLWAFE